MPVTIDHSAYPDIVDRILHHADTRTQLAFSATCRAQRKRVQHAAVQLQHRRLLLTSPHLSQSDPPLDPRLVTVADLGEKVLTIASREGVTPAQRLRLWRFQQLHTVRRAPLSTPPAFDAIEKLLLSDAHTVVDYINIDSLPPWHYRGFNLESCTGRHILHIRWRDDKPTPARRLDYHFVGQTVATEYVVVLWSQCSSSGASSGEVRGGISRLLEMIYDPIKADSLIVVTPTKDFLGSGLVISHTPIIYKTHQEWVLELGEDEGIVGQWKEWRTELP
ncbi:hypothetical protein Q8F55_000040 [Vanrija albida]|uniref:F-box domain-containing protein n=1 Tax=Vanrija albida TaxID=181172 RepID=A0ABR3QC55_9TREE